MTDQHPQQQPPTDVEGRIADIREHYGMARARETARLGRYLCVEDIPWLIEQLEAAIDFVGMYAWHAPFCPAPKSGTKCICGYMEGLKRLRGMADK